MIINLKKNIEIVKKIIEYLLAVILIFCLGYFFYRYYKKNYKSNVLKTSLLYIPTGANYTIVKQRIKNKLINYEYFIEIAESFNYKNQIKPGKYKLNSGDSNQIIIKKLINNYQEPIKLRIDAFDHISEIAKIIQINFEADSLRINSAIKKQALKEGCSDIDAIKIYFIPGKYIFFWNDSPEKIISMMKKNYVLFWNFQRQEKARRLGLTPLEVINFAAITQKESIHLDEQPKIAGLYLNRYQIHMKLQSDPTVLFAKKKKKGFDKKYYRVYYEDLSTDSPYNTYKNIGLPPLPVCSPNPEAIEAVLNAEKHDYIFMCASAERIGYHDFTKSYLIHEKNAERYRNYLNKKNIR